MFAKIKAWVAGARKTLVTAVGSLLGVLTFVGTFSAFLPAADAHWIAWAIAGLTTLSTYLVPNKTAAA